MNIQYYGHSCFKITAKPGGRATEDVVIFLDPFDKSIGLKPPSGKADAVFCTHNHYDHHNVSAVKPKSEKLLVIDVPGEYSVKKIDVIGLDTFHDKQEGKERGRNTVFVFNIEGMKVVHMGDLGTDLNSEQLEKLGEVDVLMIPVGGKYTINGKEAANLVRKIGPHLIIPMHYKVPGLKIDIADEKEFCSEMGNCPKEKINKINLKKKDLEEKNMETLLMKAA